MSGTGWDVERVVRGPAVFGCDPVQALCFKPCCRRPVRLVAGGPEGWRPGGPPVLVACEAPSCRVVWTVELAGARTGTDRAAVWRAHSRQAPQVSAGRRR
ncbi:MAG: hypothetical protein ACRDZ4_08535 [Egibacteraceae bacterium]